MWTFHIAGSKQGIKSSIALRAIAKATNLVRVAWLETTTRRTTGFLLEASRALAFCRVRIIAQARAGANTIQLSPTIVVRSTQFIQGWVMTLMKHGVQHLVKDHALAKTDIHPTIDVDEQADWSHNIERALCVDSSSSIRARLTAYQEGARGELFERIGCAVHA